MHLYQHVDRFKHAIVTKLTSRSSSKYIRIIFDHAIYRKLFGGKTELHARDFSQHLFSAGWDNAYEQNVGVVRTIYSGSKVLYPILTHPYLGNSKKGIFCKLAGNKYRAKPVVHLEMLRIFVNVQDCV